MNLETSQSHWHRKMCWSCKTVPRRCLTKKLKNTFVPFDFSQFQINDFLFHFILKKKTFFFFEKKEFRKEKNNFLFYFFETI